MNTQVEVGQQLVPAMPKRAHTSSTVGPSSAADPRHERQQALEAVARRRSRAHGEAPRSQSTTRSARSSGGTEHLGVVEEVEDERPEARRGCVTGSSSTTDAVGALLHDRARARRVDGPRRLVGVDEHAGRDLVRPRPAPTAAMRRPGHGGAAGARTPRPARRVTSPSMRSSRKCRSSSRSWSKPVRYQRPRGKSSR